MAEPTAAKCLGRYFVLIPIIILFTGKGVHINTLSPVYKNEGRSISPDSQ